MVQTLLIQIVMANLFAGCTFQFEVISQKTALENQVLGTYKELSDEVVLQSTVRNISQKNFKNESSKDLILARQNQLFNSDDIGDLKSKQIIGEGQDGFLHLVPSHLTVNVKHDSEILLFAKELIADENTDRKIIIDDLARKSGSGFTEAQRIYSESQAKLIKEGQWIQKKGGWVQYNSKEPSL